MATGDTPVAISEAHEPAVAVAPHRPAARQSSRLLAILQRIGLGAILPVLIVLAWYLIAESNIFPRAFVPTPSAVARTFWSWAPFSHSSSMFYSGHLFSDIGATLRRVVVGFAIAAVVGVALGLLIGVSALADGILSPLIRILGPVPPTTWIPLTIVVIGLNEAANDFLTFLGAVFPIVASTATTTSGVNRDLLRASRMMGDGKIRELLSVVLPGALPGIVGGLRLGIGISWMMAVTSEMLAVHGGLGYTLWNAYNYLDYPGVFSAMIMIGICGFLSDTLLRLCTRRMLHWHTSTSVRGA